QPVVEPTKSPLVGPHRRYLAGRGPHPATIRTGVLMDALWWVFQGVMAFITVPSGLMTALRRGEAVYLHGRWVRLEGGPGPAARWGGVMAAACGLALVV